MGVPQHVIRSFGLSGLPIPLPGGENRSFLADDHVLKPVDNVPLAEWAGTAWSGLTPEQYRISRPLKSGKGKFIEDGWSASRFEKGEHKKGHTTEKLAVCRALHTGLSRLNPCEMPENNDPWARAHRVAWQTDELPQDLPQHAAKILRGLLDKVSPGAMGFPQIIHADLCGNILFEEGQLPLVIDFSPFKAPAAYAEAILICDGIAWENSPLSSISLLPDTRYYKEMLTRAALFRLTVAAILHGESGFAEEFHNFKAITDALN